MQCQLCENPMTLRGGKYNCSRAYERKTCSNNKIIKAETVEARVLDGIQKHLLQPEAVSLAVKAYHDASRATALEIAQQRTPLEKELRSITGKLERAQEMYMKDLIQMDRLEALTKQTEARASEIKAKLSLVDIPPVIQLHPNAADAYKKLANELQMAMAGPDGEQIRAEVRKLIEKIVFIPLPTLGAFDLEVHGNLAMILAAARPQNAKNLTGGTCEVMLGAGVGFEPTTFRL